MTPDQARRLPIDLRFCLHVQCVCGRSTVVPLGPMKDQIGTLGEHADRLRCSKCGKAPASAHLSDSMTSPERYGGGGRAGMWVNLLGGKR